MKFRQGAWPKLMPLALIMLLVPLFGALTSHAQGPAEYRSIDGTGNNLANPDWGSTDFPLLRLVDPAYEDGISVPRGGAGTSSNLPSTREISNTVSDQDGVIPNSVGASDMLWQWGQFMDHDIDITEPGTPTEPFPIAVPTGDPFFDPSGLGNQTIFMARSVFEHTTGTDASNPRQQVNEITAWIDASNVYGSDAARATLLRRNEKGKLRTSSGRLLPFADPNDPLQFFVAGDVRVNEQSGLTAMHTLFVREHNRLANLISAYHPYLSDEEIYQRARALVAAELQIITYGEFLPLLLGQNAIEPYAGYDPTVNSSVSNEFSTAAFRVGHTMLSPVLLRLDDNGEQIGSGNLPLQLAFFNTSHILNDGIEPILRGLTAQRAQEIDPLVVDDVRNFLFGQPGAGGFDLASLNMQRGRDHGLPAYNDVREELGLGAVDDFAQITSDPALQAKLAAVYSNVDEIDLWIGGLAEDHVAGVVGETFHYILSDQFTRLRDGDRFWHENINWQDYGFKNDPMIHKSGVTLSQLKLSDIIRWNTPIKSKQENAFMAAEMLVLSGKETIDLNKRIRVKLFARGQNISRIKATCQVDKNVLDLRKVTWASRITDLEHNVLQNNYDPTTGMLEIEIQLGARTEPLVGEGTIATLSYKGIGTGTSDITCEAEYRDATEKLIPSDNTPHTVTVY